MSTSGPFGDDTPEEEGRGPSFPFGMGGFPGMGGGFPGMGGPGGLDPNMFGFLSSALGGGIGGPDWEAIAQMAASIATEGRAEPNVDPGDRMALEGLARVAELHVTQAIGRPILPGGRGVSVEAVSRRDFARRSVQDLRKLFELLSASLGDVLKRQLGSLSPEDFELEMPPGLGFPPGLDPAKLIADLMGMMGPVLVGSMSAGTVGQLAMRAIGQYDLPLPRPADAPVLVVISNLDTFADEWSIQRDEARMWILVHELVLHHVLAGTPAGDVVSGLLHQWAGGFTDDFDGLERRLGDLGLDDLDPADPGDMERIQRLFGDPEQLLGAMISPQQEAVQPRIDAAVSVVLGYADLMIDRVAQRILPSGGHVAEALRRRRVEAGTAGRFVERLFGLQLTPALLERGRTFTTGITERAGDAALDALWADPAHVPTPNELEAPGLWLARVGIEATDPDLPPLDEGFEIPDSPEGL